MLNASSLILGGLNTSSISSSEKRFISLKQPAGITLFSKNLEDSTRIDKLSLIQELQALSNNRKTPFIVAIDQEGGEVARLKNRCVDGGPALFLSEGKTDESALDAIKKYACTLGKSLLNMGVNVNFAPVLDITHPKDLKLCAINNRSFGFTHKDVNQRAGAFLHGMQESGIFGCLKHYPGIGKISEDTHHSAAISRVSEDTLWKENLKPFIRMHTSVELIMVAHCIFPQICSYEASRSSLLITDILRGKLKYEGLILCDDLTMQAVYKSDLDWKDYIVASVAAGCDMILVCSGLDRWQMACDVLELEAKKSSAFQKRVNESCERIQKFRQKLYPC